MMALPKILLKIFQPECRHIPGYVSIEEGELTEPSGKPRKINIRIGCIKCEKCERVFKWFPMGVAHDPVKGFYMKENEPLEKHLDLNEEDEKELIEALNAEGIEV
jgi:hypothetical protein